MPSFRTPRFPRFDRDATINEVAEACNMVLDQPKVVAALKPDVVAALKGGTIGARRWALRQAYFVQLEQARQVAIELPDLAYLHQTVHVGLAIKASPEMSVEDRRELLEALSAVWHFERDQEQAGQRDTSRGGPSPARRARKAERSQRDRELTAATRGDAVRRR